MGKYCYVASAQRRARHLGAHGEERGGGILCRLTYSLLYVLNIAIVLSSFLLNGDTVIHYVVVLVITLLLRSCFPPQTLMPGSNDDENGSSQLVTLILELLR